MKSLNPYRPLFFGILILIFSFQAFTQIKVQVVQKEIQKTYKWDKGIGLTIHADKSDIEITTHKAQDIEIRVLLISKHPEKDIAKHDLDLLKFQTMKKGNSITLHNHVELPDINQKPKSNLQAVYQIKVPEELEVELDLINNFGKIKVDGILSDLDIEGKFCPVNISNFKGRLSLKSTFGDVNLSNVDADVKLRSKRSNLSITSLVGSFQINADYAEIQVSDFKLEENSQINANRSKINLSPDCLDCFNYHVDLVKSSFIKPERMKFNYTLVNESDFNGLSSTAPENQEISITLNTGLVQLND